MRASWRRPRSEIVCRRYEIQHLERYTAIQHRIVRQPHTAHASTGKVAHDAVTCSGEVGLSYLSLQFGDDPVRKLPHPMSHSEQYPRFATKFLVGGGHLAQLVKDAAPELPSGKGEVVGDVGGREPELSWQVAL